MIKIIVEGPRGSGKSYFIRHYLQTAVALAQDRNFALSMGGFNIIERHCDSDGKPINELLKDIGYANSERAEQRKTDDRS